jgi:hypothetical protein
MSSQLVVPWKPFGHTETTSWRAMVFQTHSSYVSFVYRMGRISWVAGAALLCVIAVLSEVTCHPLDGGSKGKREGEK